MNIIHRLTGVLIDFLYFRLFGLRFCGRENLPEHAPYILLANHRSMGDPFALGEVCRQGVVYFMAKEELFRNPIVRWYITKMHGFPVKRGKADLAAMRTALQGLKDGHVLGIFPEGTRHHDGKIGELETGISVLALKADVPVVPVYLGGAYRVGGKLRAAVGKPLDLDDLRQKRPDSETLNAVKERVSQALHALQAVASDEKNFQKKG